MVQGYDYYQRFVARFPDVFALAAADEDEVMKYWQGLGYYSRARNLHAAARRMAEAGGFPVTYTGVRALKGVGEYTAAAICSFAYGMPYAVVDGNVYRVLSRWLGIDTPIDSAEGKKLFVRVADELLDKLQDGNNHVILLYVEGGFAEVKDNKVIILTPKAELAEHIDVKKWEAVRDEAAARLTRPGVLTDIEHTEKTLRRAEARLKTANLMGHVAPYEWET